MEEHFYIDSNKNKLYTVFYTPHNRKTKLCYLICHPFAEEKKSTQNFSVELARKISANGSAAILFDLNGCGDSEGYLKNATISSWLNDIHNVLFFLKERLEIEEIGFIGIRFGGYLGMLTVQNSNQFSRIILIEPVFDSVKYFGKILRKKYINELNTSNKIVSNNDKLLGNLMDGNSIDFEGYEISSTFYADLVKNQEKFDIKALTKRNIKIFLFKISIMNRISLEFEIFIDLAKNAKKDIYFKLIKYVPFWHNLEPVNHNIIVQEIMRIC